MKEEITATLRIPTKHQYAYIEVVVTGTPEEVIRKYLSITALYLKMQKLETEVPF